MNRLLCSVALALCAGTVAKAVSLPVRLAPPPPFPKILAQAPTIFPIAPGIRYGDYDLLTAAGPVVIHIVAANLHNPTVRLTTALADGQIISSGETVSSMAQHTGAVAGINGDYFDIGQTNQPLNVLVHNGALLRTPRKRAALAILRDGRVAFTVMSFSGSVSIGGSAVAPIDGIDQYPPPGDGISILTPAYGGVPPNDDTTLIALTPLARTPPLASYSVARVVDNTRAQPPGYYLAAGFNAIGTVGDPPAGTPVVAEGDLSPDSLTRLRAAIGGGPILLRDGLPYKDPDGPNGPGYTGLIPTTGVALAPNGTLYLIEVDGRRPYRSIGLTHLQLTALMQALGATDGMAFDGGGSSTLVAREPGAADATVQGHPSDGRERRVADALLIESTAPVGPPSKLAVMPMVVRALPGTRIPVHIAATDAAGHPLALDALPSVSIEPSDLGRYQDGIFIADRPGLGRMRVQEGDLRASIPVDIPARPGRLLLRPPVANLLSPSNVRFIARAYTRAGYALPLPSVLPWRASSGRIDPSGLYRPLAGQAMVSLNLGGAVARALVTVGSHAVPLTLTQTPSLVTVPHDAGGAVLPLPNGVKLGYDFTKFERAAYAILDLPLPSGTFGLRFDIDSDGSGGLLRLAIGDGHGNRTLLAATALQRAGRRQIVVHFPANLPQERTLHAVYVLSGFGTHRSRANGTVTVTHLAALLPGGAPGTPTTEPK
ncbi:MAG: phosphodiester glycosidase family protein [Vulcanimicrobiaceae bacterium]